MAPLVSQMTIVSVPWWAATFAAITVLESVVLYGRMPRTTAMASGPIGIRIASAVRVSPARGPDPVRGTCAAAVAVIWFLLVGRLPTAVANEIPPATAKASAAASSAAASPNRATASTLASVRQEPGS
jgi:hypothetical protein